MSAATDSAREALLRAAAAILRPLVRQLIAHGVTFPAFSRLAKEVYLDVGTRHFTLPFKKQSDSRVALVTGTPRKEIGHSRRVGGRSKSRTRWARAWSGGGWLDRRTRMPPAHRACSRTARRKERPASPIWS